MSTNQLNELKTRALSKFVVVAMSTSQDRFNLLFGSYSGQIFLRRNLMTRPRI